MEEEEKEQEFDAVWSKYIGSVRKKLDRTRLSEKTFQQISEIYDNQLRHSGNNIRIV